MEHTTELDPETSYHSFAITRHNSPRTYWVGRIAPGLIFMEDIQRTRNSGSPHISEITQAVYENHFDLSTLRYIFITKVSNVDTNLAAMHVLESREGLGSLHTSTFTWEAPSAEFHALLGSRLGRLVSYFILGAYGQGVKHVARVFTFHSTDFRRELHLRFDIEDV